MNPLLSLRYLRLVLCALALATPLLEARADGLSFTVTGSEARVSGPVAVSGDITIPSTYNGFPVTSIGVRAFSGCSGLTSVTIPGSVTSIGDRAFQYCSGLTSITMPSGVTSIEAGAFSNCSGLTRMTIPSGVTSIASGAFSNCSGLTRILFEGDAPTLGDNAFSGVSANAIGECLSTASGWGSTFGGLVMQRMNLVFDVTGSTARLIGTLGVIGAVSIPSTHNGFPVTSIGDDAFQYCDRLTGITIPGSVTSIGARAFKYCSVLTSITIPSSVTSIGDEAFARCSGLKSILIPSSVTSIGNQAFADCSGLGMVFVPGDITVEDAGFSDTTQIIRFYTDAQLAVRDALQNATGQTAGRIVGRAEGGVAGRAEVTASPNTYSLYTVGQIQDLSVGNLVLTRNGEGQFVLNYDLEQSTDLENWTRFQSNAVPLSGLPANKAFVRIRAK